MLSRKTVCLWGILILLTVAVVAVPGLIYRISVARMTGAVREWEYTPYHDNGLTDSQLALWYAECENSRYNTGSVSEDVAASGGIDCREDALALIEKVFGGEENGCALMRETVISGSEEVFFREDRLVNETERPVAVRLIGVQFDFGVRSLQILYEKKSRIMLQMSFVADKQFDDLIDPLYRYCRETLGLKDGQYAIDYFADAGKCDPAYQISVMNFSVLHISGADIDKTDERDTALIQKR